MSNETTSWFESYLEGRTQCVQMEGHSSAPLQIMRGVLQGSVLGPLLFIYINNLDFNIGHVNDLILVKC